ncbi:MAG: thioredoxin family protein [Leptospiraceae bacterium]
MQDRFIAPIALISVLYLLLIPAKIAGNPLGPIETPHGVAYLHLENAGKDSRTTVDHGFRAILEIQLEEGWHTYWKNPGDSGSPLQHSWNLPMGWSQPYLLWPGPERIPSDPLMTYGYEGRVLIPFLFDQKAGPGFFSVNMEWLECAEICIPARVQFKGRLQPTLSIQGSDIWMETMEGIPGPLPYDLEVKTDGTLLELRPLDPGATDVWENAENLYIFLEDPLLVNHAGQQQLTGNRLLVPLQPGANPENIQGLLRINDSTYSFVATVTEVPSIAESDIGTDMLLELFVYSSLAFLGGLILNLMPCVLPVLSLKVFHLMNLSGESRKRLFLYTGTYSLGVVVSFLVLSGILIALRAAGEQLGWGFHLQSSGFIIFMILFLSLFAFNLLGVFEIGLSLTSVAGPDMSRNHGHRALGSAFLSGVLATVVASPCTAPFMGTAIGFALSQSALVTLIVFFFLGLGLASPFLLAGVFPAVLKIFPRPGAWMVRFKQLLAFPLLATVAWLLWVLGNQTSVNGMTLALFSVIFLGLAAYLYGSFLQPFSGKVSSYVAAIFMAFFLMGAAGSALFSATMESKTARIPSIDTSAELPEYTPGEWLTFSPALVQRFRKANVPVFIDFTADWCLSCQVNKRTVLHTDEIQRLFKDTQTATIQADWTNEDPVISRELEKLGRNGVPVYALYIPGEEEPILLPEILTKGIMQDAFAPLQGGDSQRASERMDSSNN